jgi:hypothetical protein
VERIVVGRSATLTKTFSTAPTGTPTVAVTRSDGAAVTVGSVSGATTSWSYTIPASSNTLLDTYTETWTATIGGTAQTFVDYIEVVGDVIFTIAEFRALGTAYTNTTNYPDATVADMRTTVEQALEDACAVAFVPRYARETLSGTGNRTLLLKWPRVTAIRDITVGDTALTASELALLTYTTAGIVDGYTWTSGTGNITVGYEHGYPMPPMRIKRAALLLAKRWITPSAVDDRAINMTNETGTYAIMQAGVRGHLFDLPEVVAAVDQYSLRVGVA